MSYVPRTRCHIWWGDKLQLVLSLITHMPHSAHCCTFCTYFLFTCSCGRGHDLPELLRRHPLCQGGGRDLLHGHHRHPAGTVLSVVYCVRRAAICNLWCALQYVARVVSAYMRCNQKRPGPFISAQCCCVHDLSQCIALTTNNSLLLWRSQLYNLNKQTETFYKGLFADRYCICLCSLSCCCTSGRTTCSCLAVSVVVHCGQA